jgi:putative endonuclease
VRRAGAKAKRTGTTVTETKAERGRAARRRGRWAELLCVWCLRLKGYAILAHGHVTGRGTGAGEIDIVARRGNILAFIEVKARRRLGDAAAAVSAGQRRRLSRAAAAFVARRADLAGCHMRFDAMLVGPWRWPCHLIDAWRDEG